jgi:gluconate 5-dehydrogenase
MGRKIIGFHLPRRIPPGISGMNDGGDALKGRNMEKYGKASRIFNLEGRKTLITGGTRGLGREMAFCLLENGCDVFIAARNTADCSDMAGHAAECGRNAFFHSCDVTQSAAVAQMVAAAAGKLGRIDILINAAGMNIIKFLTELDDESWDKVLNLNLRALFMVTREAAKIMRRRHYGRIINLSSMKSVLGTSADGYASYCASKGAVNMFTKQVACELAADGITVNAIAPTFIKTAINAHQLDNPQFRASLEARIPVGRIGQFKDLMGLTLLLASDASEFLTGQIFLLDGGIAARQ